MTKAKDFKALVRARAAQLGMSYTEARAQLIEERAREQASAAYHEHPSNYSSCLLYEARFSRRCPCEADWQRFGPKAGA